MCVQQKKKEKGEKNIFNQYYPTKEKKREEYKKVKEYMFQPKHQWTYLDEMIMIDTKDKQVFKYLYHRDNIPVYA
jgi:hypothetical protein